MNKFSHTCQHCQQKIAPSVPFLQVLGGHYHPECFVCFTCGNPFKGGKYYPKDNRPYCEEHFLLLSAKKCAYCDQPVVEREGKVSIGGKLYHGKCVFCAHCQVPLGQGEMFRKDEKIYCREHFNDFFCRVCTGCGKHVADQCIAVNSEFYHPDCLRCSLPTCNKKLERYTCVSGYLRCAEHEEETCPTVQCSLCKKPIYGDVVRSCGLRVHDNCFKCGYCDNKLDKFSCKIKKKIDSVVRNVFSTRNLLLLSLKSRMNQKLFRKNQGTTKTLKQMGNLLTRARLQEILLAMEMWKIY